MKKSWPTTKATQRRGFQLSLKRSKDGFEEMVVPEVPANSSLSRTGMLGPSRSLPWSLKGQRNCGWGGTRPEDTKEAGSERSLWGADIETREELDVHSISRPEEYLLLTGVKDHLVQRLIWLRKTRRDLEPVILNPLFFSCLFSPLSQGKNKPEQVYNKTVNLLFIKNISEQSARFYQSSSN